MEHGVWDSGAAGNLISRSRASTLQQKTSHRLQRRLAPLGASSSLVVLVIPGPGSHDMPDAAKATTRRIPLRENQPRERSRATGTIVVPRSGPDRPQDRSVSRHVSTGRSRSTASHNHSELRIRTRRMRPLCATGLRPWRLGGGEMERVGVVRGCYRRVGR